MGLMDEFGAWLDQKKRNVVANAQNLPGLLSSFAQDVQEGRAADKSAFDASRSVMPEVREQGIREMNARGQELGGLLGTFAGVGAKTADVAKLGKAKAMVKAGADPIKVWQETGWTDQFPDGKWRFEISDKAAKVKPNPADYQQDRLISESVTHPDYFAAYPQLRDMTGTFDRQAKDLQGVGSAGFLEDYPHISVTASAKETKPITLHEMQHVVQGEEGFARGGSIEEMARVGLSPQEKIKEVLLRNKMARAEVADRNAINDELHKLILPGARYRRLAGEAEARLTQNRMNLTPEERLARPPWLEFDVPREQQIVRGLLGEPTGPAMAINPKEFGLKTNRDGTVTLYHGTTKDAAQKIVNEKTLRSAAEPDVYLTNAPKEIRGAYGDGTVVQVDVNPSLLFPNDQFPSGRYDFNLPTKNKAAAVKRASIWDGPQDAGPEMSVGQGKFDFASPGGGSRVAKIGDTEITYGVGSNGIVDVILVKTPKAKRGEGSARAAMEQLSKEADANGLRLALNAEPMDKGVTQSGLEKFYKSLGFRKNTGRKADFETTSGWVRDPLQKTPSQEPQAAAGGLLAPANVIGDWNWRDAVKVKQEVGIDELPQYIADNYGQFMKEQRGRADAGQLGARDLLKAYGITRSSVNRASREISDDLAQGSVRPEGYMSEWLLSPQGKAYLDAAEKGQVNAEAIADIQKRFAPFGMADTLANDLTYAAQQLPPINGSVNAAVTGPVDQWRAFAQGLNGIGPAKSGFIASLLGRGDLPTLDARQLALHTGKPAKEASKYMRRGGGKGGDAAVDRLAERQKAMGVAMDESLNPFSQHLTHHAVWDKVGGTQTTHEDLIRAMKLAGIGGFGLLGAGAYGQDSQ